LLEEESVEHVEHDYSLGAGLARQAAGGGAVRRPAQPLRLAQAKFSAEP
jgi:hypothetical protein